jgi:hypothetical protein
MLSIPVKILENQPEENQGRKRLARQKIYKVDDINYHDEYPNKHSSRPTL